MELIISQSHFVSADGTETRTVTVYTNRVEMTGTLSDGSKIAPIVMNHKPLADVRDEMAVLVNYLVVHKGWTKDESKSTDRLPEIESLLKGTVSRYQGKPSVHGSDDRYFCDITFPTLGEASKFVENFELEWVTTFRSGDGLSKYEPFAKPVIIQIPIHVWYQNVEEIKEYV
jgi:hypothetical protein